MRLNKGRWTALAVAACVMQVAQAQQPPPPPNSGQILRELERSQQAPPANDAPEVSVDEATRAPGSAAAAQGRTEVRGYRVSGNTVFTESQLLPLVQTETGSLSLAQIEAAADRITRHYRRSGYLVARAYLPFQEITDGIVRIEVLEGRYGEVRIENRSSIADDRLLATVGAAACEARASCAGELIRELPLQEGLLRLTDLPGIRVRGSLQPGQAIGSSDVLIAVDSSRRLSGLVEASNFGGQYVGRERGTLALQLANPFGIGDRLQFQGAYSSGTTYASLGYDAPLGVHGTRVSINGYWMDYELGGDFSELGAQGDTTGADLALTHAFVRSATHSLTARVQYSFKSITDDVTVAASANRRDARTYLAQLDGALQDRLFATRAINRMAIGYTGGELDIRDAASRDIDAAGARTDGAMDKLFYSISREQWLTDRLSLLVQYSGQVASQNLDSSEKFYLAGPRAIRAYPVGEAAGDRGYLATVELRRTFAGPFGGVTQVAAFHDRGRVRTEARQWTDATPWRALEGQGLGIDWQHRSGLNLSAVGALRGSGAGRTDPGRHHQVWISAGFRF
jgi:hemolysin activation/secretion protein